jgi:hypothetical protein
MKSKCVFESACKYQKRKCPKNCKDRISEEEAKRERGLNGKDD